jgi:hypothetical protein
MWLVVLAWIVLKGFRISFLEGGDHAMCLRSSLYAMIIRVVNGTDSFRSEFASASVFEDMVCDFSNPTDTDIDHAGYPLDVVADMVIIRRIRIIRYLLRIIRPVQLG